MEFQLVLIFAALLLVLALYLVINYNQLWQLNNFLHQTRISLEKEKPQNETLDAFNSYQVAFRNSAVCVNVRRSTTADSKTRTTIQIEDFFGRKATIYYTNYDIVEIVFNSKLFRREQFNNKTQAEARIILTIISRINQKQTYRLKG